MGLMSESTRTGFNKASSSRTYPVPRETAVRGSSTLFVGFAVLSLYSRSWVPLFGCVLLSLSVVVCARVEELGHCGRVLGARLGRCHLRYLPAVECDALLDRWSQRGSGHLQSPAGCAVGWRSPVARLAVEASRRQVPGHGRRIQGWPSSWVDRHCLGSS